MKLIIILLTTAILQVSASTYAQKITLNKSNVPLENVLKEIRRQSGYDFFYDLKLIKTIKPISINVKEASLEEVLDKCFANQPLTYKIGDKVVMIREKESTFIDNLIDRSQAIDVRGKIVDEKGDPIPGVTISVKGKSRTVIADSNGSFFLTGVDENAELFISSIGYQSLTLKAAKDMGIIKMEAHVSAIDQVQVIAYGTTTKRLITGNVSTVKAEDIEKQPVSNPLLTLSGRVPGLFVTQSTGFAGTGVTVKIQGQNSIYNNNEPFYVIDGVPYAGQLLPNLSDPLVGTSGVNNRQGGSPFSYINPSDIEEISILKDADATAIYGSRAANGAILITTKKGKNGKTTVNLNLLQGYGEVGRKVDLLSTPQYLSMRLEALKNDGNPVPAATDYDINGFWDQRRNVDWQKELTGGKAAYSTLHGDISGGTKRSNFLVGGTYQRQTTVFPGSFSDRSASFHYSLNGTSENSRFQYGFSGNYRYDNSNLPFTDLTAAAMSLAPDAPMLRNADGTINWAPNSSGGSTFTNPLASLNQLYNNTTTNLIANGNLSYQIAPGLRILSTFGYTRLQQNELLDYPITSVAPENVATTSRFAGYNNSTFDTWIIEPQLNYKKSFGAHNLDFLLGSTIQENASNGSIIYADGFNTDASIPDIQSAANIYPGGSIFSKYRYNALFSRISYDFDQKYLINLTARRDGSSRFGSANQFNNFGAVGIGWVFSKEEFIKNAAPFLSFGKLRASYGSTGNDQIGDYKYLSLYSKVYAEVPYQGAAGLSTTTLANPFLQWEETTKFTLGGDFGFLKDRILLSASFYSNRSSNQLVPYGLSVVSGASSILTNFPGTVENKGLELLLNSKNIAVKDFSWSSSFNITIARNKLIAFPNLAGSSLASSLAIGQPLSIKKVYHLLGTDPVTGAYQLETAAGGRTSTPDYSTDRTTLVNVDPKFYGGFSNTITYKSLQLDFLFQFVKKTGADYFTGQGLPGTFNNNQPVNVLNRWKQPNDVAPIQRFNADFSLSSPFYAALYNSDAAYGDASYIRLKNASLSWQLPASVKERLHFQNARLFFQGQNLLTITKYKGLDPETESSTTLPPLRTMTLGIQLTL